MTIFIHLGIFVGLWRFVDEAGIISTLFVLIFTKPVI